MKTEVLEKQEQELSSGAQFFRCALQVNPHHYANTYRGQKNEGTDEAAYVKAILEKARDLGIDVLAITDHNHVGSIQAFRDTAKSFAIAVFPGFEVSSQEGIHILCLYEIDIPIPSLERYLGELGITDLGTKPRKRGQNGAKQWNGRRRAGTSINHLRSTDHLVARSL